jgi:hypothetical protein
LKSCAASISFASAGSNNISITSNSDKLISVCAETDVGDNKITLECPEGMIIQKMKAAAWGQNPGTCPAVHIHSKCTLDITQFMEHYCIDSNKCPVTVTKEILGFPTDKQGHECPSDETPFTFVASFYCGIAGWGDSGRKSAPAPATAITGDETMGDMNINTTTPASDTVSEDTTKKRRNSASMLSMPITIVAAVLLSMLML